MANSDSASTAAGADACSVRRAPDWSGVTVVELDAPPAPAAFDAALRLADSEAHTRLAEPMLLSWYDRDRDLESPRGVSECHSCGGVPGYVDYGLHHGATLKVDIGQGRFVFFYLAVDL